MNDNEIINLNRKINPSDANHPLDIELNQIEANKKNNEDKNPPKNQNSIKRNETSSKRKKPYSFFLDNNKENIPNKIKNNTISTTKYNCFTFLPKALLLQFARLANVYFLIIAIIQCIPAISPLSPLTAIVPITFVLSVSIIREGIEDYARYNYDKESNSEKVRVFRDKKWTDSHSGTLQVGEVIAVTDEQTFPADIILLDSSLPEGICYIETAQLDGEKTLKFKKAHNLVTDKFKDFNRKKKYVDLFNISGSCTCDNPSDVLYKIDGNIKLNLEIDPSIIKNSNKGNFINKIKYNKTLN